ncbi:GNAT family N-acetyltransferase [Streptomyces sp. NBC_01260]|uniref:GNAT family N-acetyltransferase n=1 Tax=Streptomyces sp. NBC_01260 TaxID=2903801 RepID=UPI002E310E51|nr:GNAT family N-acetyltransferase [Streptomyces sp. NBC_01260]
MTEDIETARNEQDAEAEREHSWRAKSVGLAAVDIDDAELLHRWRSDPPTACEIGIWPRSLTAMRERIEHDDDDDRDDFLALLPDSTPIGHIALSGQNIVNGTAQVELMPAPQHRGHGHGTDALNALVDLDSVNSRCTALRQRPTPISPPPSPSSPNPASYTKASAAPPVSIAAAATTAPCSHCSAPNGKR